jgi:hypothetical protein
MYLLGKVLILGKWLFKMFGSIDPVKDFDQLQRHVVTHILWWISKPAAWKQSVTIHLKYPQEVFQLLICFTVDF